MLRWQSYFVDDLCLLFRSHLHVDVEQPVRWAHELCSETRHSSPLTQALQFNFDSYLPFDLLVKADRTSMLHSLELRSPFLDKSLIEYCARLPDSLRRRGTTTKWVLKRAFADLLPREISTRPKLGFGMPLGTWFRGRLRGFVHDTLAPTARAWDYLDRGFVDRMLLDHERGVRDLEHPIWLLLTFERWLQLLPRWRAPC
jgi:asparagine synthase (glutamine-hydrolysing)